MAYVAVEGPDGSAETGSAFHVGDGVFITARHVVEGFQIREIATTERTCVELRGRESERALTHIVVDGESRPIHIVHSRTLELDFGPCFHPDGPDVDVAAFRVKDPDPHMPWVQLGGHLDDWLGESDFTVFELIVFGYPRIPLTSRQHLIAARAEVNAQIDLRYARHVHFIVSAMPRGGFSGGLAVTEGGIALGVVTTSLLTDDKPVELGFLAVLSVEPIYCCLAAHKLLPKCQATGWDDLWNLDIEYFYERRAAECGPGRRVGASIGVFDDGNRFYLEVSCDDRPELLAHLLERSAEHLSPLATRRRDVRLGMVQVHIEQPTFDTGTKLEAARRAVREALLEAGYGSILSKPSGRDVACD